MQSKSYDLNRILFKLHFKLASRSNVKLCSISFLLLLIYCGFLTTFRPFETEKGSFCSAKEELTSQLSYGNTSNKNVQLVSQYCCETSRKAMLRFTSHTQPVSQQKKKCCKLREFRPLIGQLRGHVSLIDL